MRTAENTPSALRIHHYRLRYLRQAWVNKGNIGAHLNWNEVRYAAPCRSDFSRPYAAAPVDLQAAWPAALPGWIFYLLYEVTEV